MVGQHETNQQQGFSTRGHGNTVIHGRKQQQQQQQQRRKGGTGLNDLFIVIFGVGFVLSVALNLLNGFDGYLDDTNNNIKNRHHPKYHHDTPVGNAMKDFKDLANSRTKKRKEKSRYDQDLVKSSPKDRDDDHESHHDHHHHHKHHHHHNDKDQNDNDSQKVQVYQEGDIEGEDPVLATLNCDAYGGPSQKDAQEMVYWADIPSDATYVSPFHLVSKQRRPELQHPTKRLYMTFEPDGGGWNNIRMAMESVIGLAIATGRTLVMPPQKKMYLLSNGAAQQKRHFTFVDFFPIEEIAQEHIGLDIITMEEFLTTEGMTGHLIDTETGKVSFPPGNRTNWDGINQGDYDTLRFWLRTVATSPLWKPGECLPTFPKSGNHKDIEKLQKMVHHIVKKEEPLPFPKDEHEDYFTPTPVNGNVHDRLKEALAGRHKLCVYNETLQQVPILHFQMNAKIKMRLLVHFYAYLFFEDWTEDVWMKRFMRDHVRYIDEIQCAAARVVAKIREHVRKRDPSNTQGIYDSFHIRRGDFQYKRTRLAAEEIYKNSKDELTPNTTIFIATDERDKTFFNPLKAHYDVLFLDDFIKSELQDVNTNYFGMIDQLVASRGRIFFGCFFSTFTGYINRLRGYRSVVDKLPGYEKGVLPTTYYYAVLPKKFIMHHYAPLSGGFFNREYPVSWRDINKGIGMHSSVGEKDTEI